jgi:hypothetical protein
VQASRPVEPTAQQGADDDDAGSVADGVSFCCLTHCFVLLAQSCLFVGRFRVFVLIHCLTSCIAEGGSCRGCFQC